MKAWVNSQADGIQQSWEPWHAGINPFDGGSHYHSLTSGQTMMEVMKIMAASFRLSHALTAALSAPNPVAGHHRPISPLETPGHSWASLGQSLVGSLLLSPGSWCTHSFVCALQESVSPVLWKFCNQIPLASKVKSPRGSQSFCQIPRLGNLLWVLELLQ